MTKKERLRPELLKASRKARIAKGSATSVQEVNALIKQFEQTKQMMKQFKNGKGMPKLPF
jgi:signal recognition particle subunit SRP54